jgi:hypothetical protein
MGIPAYENNHQNRLPNIDTISQLGIISKATRCPQSYSFIIFSWDIFEITGGIVYIN